MTTPKICLCMIVKNEAHVIERCLASVKPYIHAWAICDTGSTDGTQGIIEKYLSDFPGAVVERPWVDFATNRNEALDLARTLGDFALIIDADDTFSAPPGFRWPAMDSDGFQLEVVDAGDTRYQRMAVPNLRSPWTWQGVLHEYLSLDGAQTLKLPKAQILRIHNDGARSQLSLEEKFGRDALVLEGALEREPNNARYMFYLAQSYRDGGQFLRALDAYERRVEMGGWAEEVYFSMLQAAKLRERMGDSWALVSGSYLEAYNFRPLRGEAPCELARFARNRSKFHVAIEFGRVATMLPPSTDSLFLDHSIYQWRARDEWSIAAYWCGDYGLSRTLCNQLLKNPKLPESERERVKKNYDFAVQKCGGRR